MRYALIALASCTFAAELLAAPPRIFDDRLVIELAAEQPDIVTPTGLAVDEQGRVWMIENHTHQRPGNYKGPATDRIRIFSEPDANGRFRKITTFAEGFKDSMSLALYHGDVYLATRRDIHILRDPKNEGKATEDKVIVKLDSLGDYPHNGLSGFAFDALGDMYFSLGENLGAPYKLIGSDGSSASGGGEGGSIYRCKPDGSKLERVATGFWNTFHLTFDPFGRLFAVDNDPDARGPCRLLHIIQGGDYGYRFRNGRRGLHPFTAWNGELPGTLPMVAGTAEAPSGLVAYDHIGLPNEYRGKLLVTSWGDHVIENFTLSPRGASFSAKSTILVRGGENFRPVGIVTAPDGSLYISDWVDKSYPVHGKGALWRIRMKDPPKDDGLRPSQVVKLPIERLIKLLGDGRGDIRVAAIETLGAKTEIVLEMLLENFRASKDPYERMAILRCLHRIGTPPARRAFSSNGLTDSNPLIRGETLRIQGYFLPPGKNDGGQRSPPFRAFKETPYVRLQAILPIQSKQSLGLVDVLWDADPFIAGAALGVLGRTGNTELLKPNIRGANAALRLGAVLALHRANELEGRELLPKLLDDADPGVRRAAIQWVAEDRLTEHKDAIAKSAAKEPVTRDLFEALLAAQQMLDADPKAKLAENSGEEHVARIVKDVKQPAVFRSLSLRMLRPDHPALTIDLLKSLLKSDDAGVRGESVRTLAMRADQPSQELLRTLARDASADRAFAIVGLAHSAAYSEDTRKLLMSLLKDENLRRDALRSLRGADLKPDERRALYTWWDGLPFRRTGRTKDDVEIAEQVLLVLGPRKSKDHEEINVLESVVRELPFDVPTWHKALTDREGDAKAGERVFYHLRGARCAVCHRIDGRGGQIGPDLTAIGRSHNRDKLIDSILAPSKEIAPAFTTWNLTMTDGKKLMGIILGENFDSTLTLADAEGKQSKLKRLDIEDRQASTKSLMPDDLHKLLTRQEFADLIEFLAATKSARK